MTRSQFEALEALAQRGPLPTGRAHFFPGHEGGWIAGQCAIALLRKGWASRRFHGDDVTITTEGQAALDNERRKRGRR